METRTHRNIRRNGRMLLAVCLALLAGRAVAAPLAGPPPAFEATDAQGQTFRYPEDLERPTIVLFWATWCPYCKALMPHLQSILLEFPGQVDLIALSFRDDGDPTAVIDEYGYLFRSFENADAVAASWGVKGTPGLFLADAKGHIVFDRRRIVAENPAAASAEDAGALKHYQKAARGAPFWAAKLREALDEVLSSTR